MGFLKQKKQEEPQLPKSSGPAEVEIKNLQQWVRESFGDKISGSEKTAKSLHSRILKNFSEICDSAKSLSKAKIETDFKAIVMTRDGFAKKALSFTSRIKQSEMQLNQDSLAKLKMKCETALGEMLSQKQAWLFAKYFKKDAQKTMDSIKAAQDSISELSDFISSGAGFLGLEADIKDEIYKHQKLLESAQALNRNLKSAALASEEFGRKNYVAMHELEKIESSKEWADLKTLLSEILSAENEISSIEGAVLGKLSAPKKIVKKMEHEKRPVDHDARAFLEDPFPNAKKLDSIAGIMDGNKSELLAQLSNLLNKRDAEIKKLAELKVKADKYSAIKERHEKMKEDSEGLKEKINGLENKVALLGKELEETNEKTRGQLVSTEQLISKRTGSKIILKG